MKVISITGEDDFQAQREKLRDRMHKLIGPLDRGSVPTVIAIWTLAEMIGERMEAIDTEHCEECDCAWAQLHESLTLLNIAAEKLDAGVDMASHPGK